ncbi:zinc ABC transporter substrate-binding protein [Patescibacteria group bacterium]|nr:zinc ABC transporter substrate-binding protein [Patescibacteria group bacterium]
MNKKRLILLFSVLVIIVAIFIVDITNDDNNFSDKPEKIKIITTIFPLYDFAKTIVGDNADVSMLLPPGIEPHSFEPKPSDIIKINKSDIFIYTGDFMEPWAKDILDGLDNKSLHIVNFSDRLELMGEDKEKEHHFEDVNTEKYEHEHEHGEIDPHIWLDFSNCQIIIDSISNALIKSDSANSIFYASEAEKLKNDLSILDDNFKEGLNFCETNTFIHGGHYAFGYLAKRYELNYLTAQGFMPNSEPTVKDLIALIEQLKEKEIKYVFYEELLSPKIAKTISSETGAELLLLNPASNLSKKDFENNISFIAIMEKNLENLKLGMQCQ